jgi:predicted ATP-grasp superfamily ATP-dependent carboligase
MKAISVLIPDGEDHMALWVMRSLGITHRVRVDVMTSHRLPSSMFSRFCRHCHFTTSDITNKDRCDAILKTIAKTPIDVLLPVSVAGIHLVAAERKAFVRQVALPPLPDSFTLDTANDKTALFRFAQRHGMPVPPSLVFPDDVSEYRDLLRLNYPVLLKPPSLGGGQGFQLFHDPQKLATFLEANPALRGSSTRHLLQSYLPGTDLGLNVLCRHGEILAFTVQENQLRASFPFGPPVGIHFVQDVQALEAGRKLLSALRWNGVANLDMVRYPATGETMLLEINPRYWRTLMGSVYAGVNFPYLSCLSALDQPLPATDYRLITYAEKSVALKQARWLVAGRSFLPGFRFRNTTLWIILRDPLPTLVGYVKRIFRLKLFRKK